MEFLALLLAAAVVWFLYSKWRMESRPNGGVVHCMTCGIDAVPKPETKGSLLIELILGIRNLSLIPGFPLA